MNQYVEEILKSDLKFVMSMTGGGSIALSELLRCGGASNNLLAAYMPYSKEAFDSFVINQPIWMRPNYPIDKNFKYSSSEASKLLASGSYNKACEYTISSIFDIAGVGVACSLAKNGVERIDREHRAYITIQTSKVINTISVIFNKTNCKNHVLDNSRLRPFEEEILSELILQRLVKFCNPNSVLNDSSSIENCVQISEEEILK